jgi:hypothetical protein
MPRVVTDPAQCYFYHTMDVPGHGLMEGEWDLREGVDAYLGRIGLQGKRVLEVGTASGFLCFAMEKRGADVIAFDLAPRQPPDLVPFPGRDPQERRREHSRHLERLANAYWLCHRLGHSAARRVEGTVYAIPDAIGPVDVTTFGCVLLHLRDPFAALTSALRLTREKVIVTEPVVIRSPLKRWLLRRLVGPAALFFPRAERGGPETTWWTLTPELIQRYLAVLGFEKTDVTYHTQMYRRQSVPLFTVVGQRTRPLAENPTPV